MSEQNGHSPKRTITANDAIADGLRLGIESALGQTGFNSATNDLADRNHFEVFGWPKGDSDGWDEENWLALYLRNAYARVINDKPAKASWRDNPEIKPRGDDEHPITEQVKQLNRNQRLWSVGERVDRVAGIGQHGLILIDTQDRQDADDWDTDAREQNLSGLDGITGMRPVLQVQIEDIEWGDASDERWGEPVRYTLDLSEDVDDANEDDPIAALNVHWSRVIDVPATRPLDDDIFARPRAEPVLNNLLDIEKTLGAAAEAAYRAADYGLHINTDPERVDLSDGAQELADEITRYEQNLQRYIRTQGTEIERLGGDIQDPSGIVENNIDAISAETGIPKKELRGNESGEVTGAEQDKLSFFGMIQERREQYVTPHIVRSLIDRLIEFGVLNRPDMGYEVQWPDLHELSESDRADIQKSRSSVIANVPGLVGDTALEYLKEGAEAIEIEEQTSLPAMDEANPQVQEQFGATTGTEQTANDKPSLDTQVELKDSVVSAAEAALEADEKGLIPDSCGTGRGTQRANQIANNNVTVRDLLTRDNGTPIPAYNNSHSEDFSGGAEETAVSNWTEEMWSDCGNAGLARWGAQSLADVRWWMRKANEFARKRDEEEPYPEVTGNATQFSEGDPVQTPQGLGVVTEVRTESFEGKGDETVQASESSPTYIVALKDQRVGVGFYSASELTSTELPETDIENPVEDVQQTANTVCELTSNGITANQWDPPQSWEESDTPARVIALDAWASMGGQFNCRGGGCCMGTMRDKLGEQGAREFCASFKDWILGGWEGWRKGG